MYGISRGGMNTYQISRLSDEIKAIAVVGAPVNPRIDFKSRPEMYTNVYLPLVGDSITHKADYDYRSPLLWAGEVNEPILIMHGDEDWRVTSVNAELMHQELIKFGKTAELMMIQGGNHSLSSHTQMRNDTIIGWFDKYLK